MCPSSDGGISPNDEYFLRVGFASMLSSSQNINGAACFVPTDGPCYIGFEPGSIPQPGFRFDRGTACRVDSKVYMRGNSTNGANQGNIDHLYWFDHGNIDHLAELDPALAQLNNNYETAQTEEFVAFPKI